MSLKKFPSEFLYLIANHLTIKDHFNCLYVCKSWYHTFQRIVYKKVTIHSDEQLERFIETLEDNHHWIKEIYLNDNVTLTQYNFKRLIELCPDLEVFDFDTSQWEHIQEKPTWNRMRRMAPISFGYFDWIPNGLSHLHVKYNLDELESLVEKLKLVPLLEHLTLEEKSITTDPLPIHRHLQKLHQTLTRLKTFDFIRNNTPNQESSALSHDLSPLTKPSNLKSLSLQGHVDCIDWFNFLSKSYPHLEQLELSSLTTSRFGTKWMWQSALVQLIQSLKSLKVLKLGGKNVPQLFSKALALELQASTVKDLYVDFQTYQAIESCQFLMLVANYGFPQLKLLRLRVWEQIPGWSGVTSNLFHCKQLVTLELSLSKGLIDQFPFTPFLIDQLLGHLPQLENLILIGASVQVTYHHFVDLDKQHSALKHLELKQSKIENHETVSMYLSYCCQRLETLIMYKCETEMKKRVYHQQSTVLNTCDLPFVYSNNLQKIQLSTFLIYVGTIQRNDYIGIEVITDEDVELPVVWCSIDKSGGISIYPTYNICEDEYKCIELSELYRSYRSSDASLDCMPGCYTPGIGIITIQVRKMLSEIALDNLKIPVKYFK